MGMPASLLLLESRKKKEGGRIGMEKFNGEPKLNLAFRRVNVRLILAVCEGSI